jgi:hypothetical protein
LLSSHVWPLYCLSVDLRLLINPLLSSHVWSLYCLSFYLRLLITPLLPSHVWPLYCLSFDLRLLLPHWYLQTFGHCMSVLRFTASDYPFVIFTRLAIVLSIL